MNFRTTSIFVCWIVVASQSSAGHPVVTKYGPVIGTDSRDETVKVFKEEPKPEDATHSNSFMDYWVQFAKTGDPNVEGQTEWPPFTTSQDQYLVMDEEITVETERRREACDLLDESLKERRQPDAPTELDERIDEINQLIDQLRDTEGIDETPRWIRYLKKSVDSLREMQQVRTTLKTGKGDAAEPVHNRLEKRTQNLQQQIDADEEFVAVIRRLMKSNDDDREQEVEDLLPEINEFLQELESQRKTLGLDSDETPSSDNVSLLTSGEYFITQSWSQEKDFRRPFYVSVPETRDSNDNGIGAKLPVFVFLHGNGGNAENAMRGFLRNRKLMASRFVMVFPQGYRESWNIVSERSKADDRGFIEAIVLKLAAFKNVDPDNFSVMGSSNGAALVNQLAIESTLPHIRNYITGVSPLNVWQYDGTQFKAKGDDNNYVVSATPMTGKRLLNISGTNDKLVPYHGGPSNVIPAKDGKLAFVAAEESTFVWARHMGYEGKRLAEPTRIRGDVEIYNYLDGDVIHCKVNSEGHGATGAVSEETLLRFIEGG